MMDARENELLIFKGGEPIESPVSNETREEWSGSSIGGDSGGNDDPNSSATTDKVGGEFGKQCVSVHISTTCKRETATFPRKDGGRLGQSLCGLKFCE